MSDGIFAMPGMEEVADVDRRRAQAPPPRPNPTEIAVGGAFLLSADASFVTGPGHRRRRRLHRRARPRRHHAHGPVVNGRHAVVTGGGTGIGGAVVDALAAAGARVTFVEVDEERAVARVAAAPGEVEAVLGDATDPELIAGVISDLGPVDVLVNNVGHHLRSTPFLASDPERWDSLRTVNLDHALRWCHALVPGMVERGTRGGGERLLGGGDPGLPARPGLRRLQGGPPPLHPFVRDGSGPERRARQRRRAGRHPDPAGRLRVDGSRRRTSTAGRPGCRSGGWVRPRRPPGSWRSSPPTPPRSSPVR